ncbi:MAG: hypothetical protein V7L05_26130 [Nostoc sp.]|uniref:hypothetical protein n=1 Tax=Nostoc sp. TaxID=1180 RepID=UPI002FFCC32F
MGLVPQKIQNPKSKIRRVKNQQLSPMPNAPCPIPHAPCPMPHAQCPMPNSEVG